MHIVYSFTSGYFLIYDDEYECVRYDDDDHHHVLHDIREFVDLRFRYRELARL